MTEPLGIAAASLQLVELSAKILATGYSDLSSVADAPTEIQQLLRETAGLNCILGQLHSMATQKPESPHTRAALLELQQAAVLTSCLELLRGADNDTGIAGTVELFTPVEGQRIRNWANRMAWPLKHQKDVATKLQRLSRLVKIISVALEVDIA